jgi:hypothetical protein
MSIIKDIVDEIKDVSKSAITISKIRKALILELKLNLNFLNDFSKKNLRPSDEELIKTIKQLRITEIEAAIKCQFPTNILSDKKVTQSLLGSIRAERTVGNDIETMLDKLFLMISYIKDAYDKKGVKLFVRLRNIYFYHRIALRLLEENK